MPRVKRDKISKTKLLTNEIVRGRGERLEILKTRDERLEFMNIIKTKLGSLGVLEYPAITDLVSILENYVENGESVSGKIQFYEVGRTIEYVLSKKKNFQNSINLKLTSD